jgi:hypothetical protein
LNNHKESSERANKKKNDQLGMPFGTANNRLRKNILFNLLVRLNETICFQCKQQIKTVDELSIEHKIPWLDNDSALFWDLDNIAFSHLRCNIRAADKSFTVGNERPWSRKHNQTHVYCPVCKQMLAKSEFYPNRANKTGVSGYCKCCTSTYKKSR